MLVYQLNVVAAVALLIRLITRVKSQGTFVHSDLGGHTITNEIRFPNVDWQYAEPTGTLIKSENTGSREEKKPDTEFLNLRQQLEIVRASATIDLAQSAYIDILRQLQSKTEKAGLDELLMMHPDVLAVKEDTYHTNISAR